MPNFDPEEQATAPALDNPASFWAEGIYQKRCAGCDRTLTYPEAHVHHALTLQLVRRLGAPLYHVDNALLVCNERGEDCHGAHHSCKRPLKTTALTDRNIAFAGRWMGGPPAVEYLRRVYDDLDLDPRLRALEGGDAHVPILLDPRGPHMT